MERELCGKLVLASASPRRSELLAAAGLRFEIAAADIDEQPLPGEPPEALVRRLAAAKAEAVANRFPHAWVVGADTVVVLDDEALGKPRDAAEACAMLQRLQGREHAVWGGLALHHGERGIVVNTVRVTKVRFAALRPHEIEAYVATGEPMDKAGAYAIQGRGGQFVEAIEGSYSNVVGLDVAELLKLLRSLQALD